MSSDFYCEEVLSGRTSVRKVVETENVLAYHHTRPSYPTHIVAIPKKHIGSLATIEESDEGLFAELMQVVRQVAAATEQSEGACRVITNLGSYQDSKHLHWHIVSGERLK